MFDRQYPVLGHLGGFTLILCAMRSIVPSTGGSLGSLIKSMCDKLTEKQPLCILAFFSSYTSFCCRETNSAGETIYK